MHTNFTISSCCLIIIIMVHSFTEMIYYAKVHAGKPSPALCSTNISVTYFGNVIAVIIVILQ